MTNLLPVLRHRGWLIRPGLGLFDRLFDDIDFPTIHLDDREWMPKIDVKETEKEIVVNVEVPGMTKDDINILLTDGLLTVSGEKRHESEDKKENFHVIERRFGSFKRSIRMPNDIEAEKIDASYKDGVLTIIVPKSEAVQPKKIEIKS